MLCSGIHALARLLHAAIARAACLERGPGSRMGGPCAFRLIQMIHLEQSALRFALLDLVLLDCAQQTGRLSCRPPPASQGAPSSSRVSGRFRSPPPRQLKRKIAASAASTVSVSSQRFGGRKI